MSNENLHHSVLYFAETSICLYPIISGNIRYVNNAFKTRDKIKGKTKGSGFIY